KPLDEAQVPYRNAIAESGHATDGGDLDAFNAGADQTSAIAQGSFRGAAKDAAQSGRVSLQRALEASTPARARAIRQGIVSRLGESNASSVNPLTGFGSVPALVRGNRLATYLAQADAAANQGTFQH